jgi:iron complex outermembrane receptor protein/vitamin B12 transporter
MYRAGFEIAPVRRPVLLLFVCHASDGEAEENAMYLSSGRHAANVSMRARVSRRVALTLLMWILSATCAQAVVVRGRLTDALGKAVSGGQVRLVAGGKTLAMAYAGADGTFELRSSEAGRFTLLGSAGGYLPGIGVDFYGGATDVLQQDVVLATNTVRQDVTVSATGIPTPLPQLTSPVTVIPDTALALQVGVMDELRQTPGAFVVQTGQTGGVTSLFLRGGSSTANLVTIDGMPADDVGGVFDYGTVSSTAISRIEVVRGPDSAMYGTDAGAGVVTVETPRGTTSTPVIDYSGDAGNLHTWRNEAAIGGTFKKLDYYGAFSRFDTSNALAFDEYHSATAAINVGYDFNGNTQLRVTLRNADSATGVPGPHDFWGISDQSKERDQDLYSGVTLENRYKGAWHNLVRYGIARKREQQKQFGNQGTPVVFDCGDGCSYTEYFGPVVTIRGANGYTATGQTDTYGDNDDLDSNRDQLYYQSDYSFSTHLIALFGFRYDKERGSFNDADFYEFHTTKRRNFEYNLELQGEFWNKLFYSAGGAVEKNHLYGVAGTPRLGLTYVPMRPSGRLFHGTRLRANAATGVQEPTLAIEYESLYKQLLAAGDTADIAAYHITPQSAQRSRSYDVGVDQNVLGEKLVVKAGYFHNVFDRQLEAVSGQALVQYFGPAGFSDPECDYTAASPFLCNYYAYVNSLAYRAQGAEVELVWQPRPRVLIRGGYTYLDARVLQSFASDAVSANQGFPTENPNLPGIAIGAESPLTGARPFRRAPNTGYFDALYTRPKFTLDFKGAMASRSDDSTYLDYSDIDGGNSLILPNRDLDFGYVKLDIGGTYTLKHGLTYFAQINNLLNDQHIGPIGFPGSPLTFRTGLKLHLGRE